MTNSSKLVRIGGLLTECNPTLCAINDCTTAVNEGTDPDDLISASGRCEADEALINAMGRDWVVKVALGDGDAEDTDDAWETHGLPWCAAYNKAYSDRAAELAGGRSAPDRAESAVRS